MSDHDELRRQIARRRSRFGPPPQEPSNVLSDDEPADDAAAPTPTADPAPAAPLTTSPVSSSAGTQPPRSPSAPAGPAAAAEESSSDDEEFERIDGRSLRRTGRTVPFSTRVTKEFDRRVKLYAKRNDCLIVEVLERAMDALEKKERAG